jgi:hypothetical protein
MDPDPDPYIVKQNRKKNLDSYNFETSFGFLSLKNDVDPDALIRGMDPRIRIHTKMSWIRNTAKNNRILWIRVQIRFHSNAQCRKRGVPGWTPTAPGGSVRRSGAPHPHPPAPESGNRPGSVHQHSLTTTDGLPFLKVTGPRDKFFCTACSAKFVLCGNALGLFTFFAAGLYSATSSLKGITERIV